MKNKKVTFGTIPKSNQNIVEKKGANSIPFNKQIHGNSSEDKTITLQYCITLHYERWLYDQKVIRSLNNYNTDNAFKMRFRFTRSSHRNNYHAFPETKLNWSSPYIGI